MFLLPRSSIHLGALALIPLCICIPQITHDLPFIKTLTSRQDIIIKNCHTAQAPNCVVGFVIDKSKNPDKPVKAKLWPANCKDQIGGSQPQAQDANFTVSTSEYATNPISTITFTYVGDDEPADAVADGVKVEWTAYEAGVWNGVFPCNLN